MLFVFDDRKRWKGRLFIWVDEAVRDEVGKVDAKHDELVNDVKNLKQSDGVL